MPALARITIFPIKSLPGIDCQQINITPAGTLENDRRFALFDAKNQIINAKQHAEVHQLFAVYDLKNQRVTLDIHGLNMPESFDLQTGNEHLNQWLSEFFGFQAHLKENNTCGFFDDLERPGPTVISTASLQEVSSWFPDLTVEEIRYRFRSNLEISDCAAFWEDRLNQQTDLGSPFKIGAVSFEGLKHCIRCPVPTRDTKSGEERLNFQEIFIQNRARTFPDNVAKSSFDHLYCLAINTRILPHSSDSILHIKDSVTL